MENLGQASLQRSLSLVQVLECGRGLFAPKIDLYLREDPLQHLGPLWTIGSTSPSK